jgi:hypothetical protein
MLCWKDRLWLVSFQQLKSIHWSSLLRSQLKCWSASQITPVMATVQLVEHSEIPTQGAELMTGKRKATKFCLVTHISLGMNSGLRGEESVSISLFWGFNSDYLNKLTNILPKHHYSYQSDLVRNTPCLRERVENDGINWSLYVKCTVP